MFARLPAFIGLIAVLVAIPGPAVVLIMKNAVLRGRRSAGLVALGVFSGDLVWVAASVTGLTAVLVASRPAFEALRLLGAAYLLYLGVRLLLRRRNAPVVDVGTPTPTRPARPSVRQAFGEGALCELSNPKTLLVFTSVIPPFVPDGGGLVDVALLGALFASLGLISLLGYAFALGTTHGRIRRPRLVDGLLRAGGAALVAFGAGLAVESTEPA